MMPTPTPAPPMPMQAMPAPIYFAATGSITNSFCFPFEPSMARVNRIVEIDASENGEDVGLQERHQHLQRKENDDHQEWQGAPDPSDDAEAGAEEDDEAGENLQRDVSCQHVREKTDAVRDRPRHERQNFDEDDERQNVDRHALGHEQVEEMEAVPPQPVTEDEQEHRDRQRRSDDDVAGDGERVGDEADHIHRQDEHEQRENEGEELHAFGAGGTAHRRCYEFV